MAADPYDRIAGWIESLYIPASSIGDNKHIATQIRGMKPRNIFEPRQVERGCSLGHIAVNRIFETFDVSGTPDKNRVKDVVDELILHVERKHHAK